jgi:hypothetical protein
MKPVPIPSVGRIVHYVARGSADGVYIPEHRAALIIGCLPDRTLGAERVNLAVFNPQGMHWTYAVHDETGKRPGTWHWCEPVDPVYVTDEEGGTP